MNAEEVCDWTVYLDLDLDRSPQGDEVSSCATQGKEVSVGVLQEAGASFYVCQAGETSCVHPEVFRRGVSSHTDSVDGTSLSQEIPLKLSAFYAWEEQAMAFSWISAAFLHDCHLGMSVGGYAAFYYAFSPFLWGGDAQG